MAYCGDEEGKKKIRHMKDRNPRKETYGRTRRLGRDAAEQAEAAD